MWTSYLRSCQCKIYQDAFRVSNGNIMYKLKMYYAKTSDESPMPNKRNLVK
jgi:hypothetical protein